MSKNCIVVVGHEASELWPADIDLYLLYQPSTKSVNYFTTELGPLGPDMDRSHWVRIEDSVVERLGLRVCQPVERNGNNSLIVPISLKGLPVFHTLAKVPPCQLVDLEKYLLDRRNSLERLLAYVRALQLMRPIGYGQVDVTVAEPEAGKTWDLRVNGAAIAIADPDAVIVAAITLEREDEVAVFDKAEPGEESLLPGIPNLKMWYFSPDTSLEENHLKMAMLFAYIRRLVEAGKNVFLLLDSLLRMVRVYDALEVEGKTGEGGISRATINTLRTIMNMFGAVNGRQGSATLIATLQFEISRGDTIIVKELMGMVNSHSTLRKALAEKNMYPALAIHSFSTDRAYCPGTSTRTINRIVPKRTAQAMKNLRASLPRDETQALAIVLAKVAKTETNEELLKEFVGGSHELSLRSEIKGLLRAAIAGPKDTVDTKAMQSLVNLVWMMAMENDPWSTVVWFKGRLKKLVIDDKRISLSDMFDMLLSIFLEMIANDQTTVRDVESACNVLVEQLQMRSARKAGNGKGGSS